MDLIVAVYDDWGIGKDGTQPVALAADRAFFRELTRGAMVIAGRRTVADFPGGKPLPGRTNLVLTRGNPELPGFTLCHSPQEALELAEKAERAFVIGGGSVYRELLPLCHRAYVTKVHTRVDCDTWFPNLDADPEWICDEVLSSGREQGIAYEMLLYTRIEKRQTV